MHRKNKPRINQIAPVISVDVQKSEEKLTPSNEVCGTIECSVIVGDQLACNQQLCHVKWSNDQASTPTAKLIYVQPCSSPVVNMICPACKQFNCKQCFQKTENEVELKPLSVVKSTQFPEDNENICPLCTGKAVKVYKTEYVQTEEEHDGVSDPVLKPIQENIITRHVHSAKSMERPSRAKNKPIQSSPATPRKSEHIMTCPHCRKRSIFKSQANKSHACPVCNQQCTNNLTCTSCFFNVPATYVQEELKKSQNTKNESPQLKADKKRKSSSQIKKHFIANEMTQVSPEDFEEAAPAGTKFNEDKVTQVSSSDFVAEATSPTPLVCSVCKKNAPPQTVGKHEMETQASLHEFLEGSPRYLLQPRTRLKTAEYKATNVSSKELLDEMQLILLGRHSAERIFENTNFECSMTTMTDNEATQVSPRDFFLQQETSPKEDKLTQVSSRDFVQMERRPCGAPNCTHPKCAKHTSERGVEEEEQEVFPKKQTVDEVVQTEETTLKSVCCKIPEYVDEETITDQFKQISCQTTQSLEQELPKELPECIDPKCSCVINEREILVCNYCESLQNNTGAITNTLSEVVEKTGCKCGMPTCVCCKEEAKELPASPKKCFCIKTENALIRCTFCEQKQKGMAEYLPICTSSVTCLLYEGRNQDPNEHRKTQVENLEHSNQTNQMKSARSYKTGSEDEEHKNKSVEASEKNENEVNEDDYASSTCTSDDSENRAFDGKYLTAAEMKLLHRKEREDMALYLASKEAERFSPEPVQNVTVFTLQHTLDAMKMESKQAAKEVGKIQEDIDNEAETKYLEWEALAEKHAAYQERLRKSLDSNIEFDEDKKVLHDNSLRMLENTQSEMQNVYNYMIKNLLERQSQKESNLLYLEKLNCGCDSEAECSRQQTANCSARTEDESCKERTALKGSNLLQFPSSKFDTQDREHEDDGDGGGNVQLDTTERIVSSDMLIISDNVSLSTITEEISGTPSEVISISKESEPSNSKEQLPEKPKVEKEKDLNATYCMKAENTTVDGQQVLLQKKCNQSCKRDAVFVPLIPLKFQEAEKTTKNIFYSARCRTVSPKPCSARSEKCPRKSAGFFEPFMFSQQTYGSTKTSFTASDNESAVDSVHHQDTIKTLQSTTGSSVSFNLHEQEDRVCSPMVETLQSQSVPITSRECIPLMEESKTVYYCRHSIPCTPKKLRWQDTADMQANSLTDILETTPTNKCGTYRKESDYDEDNATPSMVVIKNFHPEMYETDRSKDNEAKIVPPLPIANITPEHSESEESRPISCSSHLSARTLQTIDHYNLECCSSLKSNPKCIHLEEMKKSKYGNNTSVQSIIFEFSNSFFRQSSSGLKSQPLSTRAHPMVERSMARRQFNVEPTVRERRIINVQPKSSHSRKKSASPKSGKVKSSTARSFRQKTTVLSPYKSCEKKKSSRKSSARKSKMKSEPTSPEHGEYVCNCEFYKNSRTNYCRVHGMGAQSVPVTCRSNQGSKSTMHSPKKLISRTPSLERPKTSQESRSIVMKSGETTPKTDDT